MTEFFSLKGKVAVVTGGSQGIGMAAAERLAQAGARVAIGDLKDCSELATRLDGVYLKTDVSDPKSVTNLMQCARDQLGGIDIIVNNAGVATPLANIVEVSSQDIEFCFRVNTLGVIHGIQCGAPLMRDGGSIVNTCSLAGKVGVYGFTAYGASKFSVVGITQTAALDLADRRIRVNAVCPTSVDTPMAAEGDQSQLDMEKVMVPLARICQPEEVAALIHFLVADDCRFVNGQAINICGGMSAGVSAAAWEAVASSCGD